MDIVEAVERLVERKQQLEQTAQTLIEERNHWRDKAVEMQNYWMNIAIKRQAEIDLLREKVRRLEAKLEAKR
jgi:hypothetical protein